MTRNPVDTIERIEDDFGNERPPFDEQAFPERELLDRLDSAHVYERSVALFVFCTCDYNRDAFQLVGNIVELYEQSPMFLSPRAFVDRYTEDELSEMMGEVGFRYRNRDARAVYTNYEILYNQYGTVQNLLADVDYDSVGLVERVRGDGFLCLKGKKIAPMFARIMSENVRTLDRLWELDIAVDTHIRRLSKELFASGLVADETKLNEDDFLRSVWREVASDHDIDRSVVDGALWLIGNNWDDWGESYWEEVRR